jgi:hypothetical protein
MSTLEPNTPPAGEEIHLPGASLQPVLLAFGIMIALVGVTLGIFLLISGLVLSVAVIVRWIADTRRDIDALPAEHDAH